MIGFPVRPPRLLIVLLTTAALVVPAVASAHPGGGHGRRGPAYRVYRQAPPYVVRRQARPRVYVGRPRARVVWPPVVVVPAPPPVVVVPRYRYEVQPVPAPPDERWEDEVQPVDPDEAPDDDERWGDDDPEEVWEDDAPPQNRPGTPPDLQDPWRPDPPTYQAPRAPAPRPSQPQNPTPAPAPAPERASQSVAGLEQEILRLVNVERQRAGLTPLKHAPALVQPARRHSREMLELKYFSHTSPVREHAEFTDRLRLAGVKDYGVAGENLAMRSRTPDLAAMLVQMWMDSPGHRANILEPRFRYLGVGVHGDDRVVYATQLFTSKLNGR